jgi:hypothetical protein
MADEDAGQATAIKAAMQKMMQNNRPNSGIQPPNLHLTEDQHENCSTCIHWNGRGECLMYDYKTQPEEVCDSWTPEPE